MEKIKLTNQENMSELALCWHQSKVTEEQWDVAANEKKKSEQSFNRLQKLIKQRLR